MRRDGGAPEVSIAHFEVFAEGLDHPECLAFDGLGNLWAGGEAGQVYRIDDRGSVQEIANLGSFNGGLAVSPSGDLIVCNPRLGLVRVKTTGEHSVFAAGAGSELMVESNFAVFDRYGRLYATDSGGWKKHCGRIFCFESNGDGRIAGGPFGYANGLALSNDGRVLFMAESDTDRVLSFEVFDDGTLGPPAVFAEQVGRVPDGLALDESGNLFVACYGSEEILRIDPSGAVALFAYDGSGIILSRPTNLAFGGANHECLYVSNLGGHTVVRTRTRYRGQQLTHGR